MSNRHGDINDDEIRVISSGEVKTNKKKRRLLPDILWVVASLLLIAVLGILFFSSGDVEDEGLNEEATEQPALRTTTDENINNVKSPAYTIKTDTIVNGVGLSILTPDNAIPILEIGNECLTDSTIVLTM